MIDELKILVYGLVFDKSGLLGADLKALKGCRTIYPLCVERAHLLHYLFSDTLPHLALVAYKHTCTLPSHMGCGASHVVAVKGMAMLTSSRSIVMITRSMMAYMPATVSHFYLKRVKEVCILIL